MCVSDSNVCRLALEQRGRSLAGVALDCHNLEHIERKHTFVNAAPSTLSREDKAESREVSEPAKT